MTAGFPVTNLAASTVLSSDRYTPVASNVGAHFANATPGISQYIKAGGVLMLIGSLAVDVGGAASAGEVICELTAPPLTDAQIAAFGFGATVNAVAKGAAAGSGVVRVGSTGAHLTLILDAQAHVATGYVIYYSATLLVLEASPS